jgi:hypothetical protein
MVYKRIVAWRASAALVSWWRDTFAYPSLTGLIRGGAPAAEPGPSQAQDLRSGGQ